MNILFDPRSSQVQVQTMTLARLNTLHGALNSEGFQLPGQGGNWRYGNTGVPISDLPDGAGNVLTILTRYPVPIAGYPPVFPPDTPFTYSDAEVAAIRDFVESGGGLLLMSNHGIGPGNDAVWSENDAKLAEAFFVRLLPAYFVAPGGPMVFEGDLLNADFADTLFSGVTSVVAHDCCGVSLAPPIVNAGGKEPKMTWLMNLPPGTSDIGPNHFPTTGQSFGVFVQWGKGKVIVLGNSGWVADDGGCPIPSQGIIPAGNNLRFLLNCLEWLGDQPITSGV